MGAFYLFVYFLFRINSILLFLFYCTKLEMRGSVAESRGPCAHGTQACS